MKGGDRYEPRKTFLLADLQEIVRDIRGVSIVAWLHCSQGIGFSDFQPLKFSEAFCSCMGIYLASTWLAQANRLILR